MFDGNRSLSTSVTMQLCCLALAYVCVSLGACVYLFFDYIFPLVPSPPPSISLKSSYPYIFLVYAGNFLKDFFKLLKYYL